jgi:carboxymethylenebutenolidase
MGEIVRFTAGEGDAPGYLAIPGGEGPFPGVVVIQEYWGLVDHIKSVADRFARAGFVALAPDLYHGQAAVEPDDARKLAMAMQTDTALQDIQGAVDHLTAMPRVSPKRVGVVGFCMGGGLAARMSYMGRDVGAVVVFYGKAPLDEDTVPTISVPFLGLYGSEDHGITVENVNEWDRLMIEHNKPHRMVVYPGAGHAFFNEDRPSVYDPEASEDAWNRTMDWLKRYLV